MKSVRTPEKIRRVPNKPRTQHRSVRVDDSEWGDLGTVTEQQGTDRAKVINQFIDWYLRRPGAKLPVRPSREDIAEATKAGES